MGFGATKVLYGHVWTRNGYAVGGGAAHVAVRESLPVNGVATVRGVVSRDYRTCVHESGRFGITVQCPKGHNGSYGRIARDTQWDKP